MMYVGMAMGKSSANLRICLDLNSYAVTSQARLVPMMATVSPTPEESNTVLPSDLKR